MSIVFAEEVEEISDTSSEDGVEEDEEDHEVILLFNATSMI